MRSTRHRAAVVVRPSMALVGRDFGHGVVGACLLVQRNNAHPNLHARHSCRLRGFLARSQTVSSPKLVAA
jgi:hypothetical protein